MYSMLPSKVAKQHGTIHENPASARGGWWGGLDVTLGTRSSAERGALGSGILQQPTDTCPPFRSLRCSTTSRRSGHCDHFLLKKRNPKQKEKKKKKPTPHTKTQPPLPASCFLMLFKPDLQSSGILQLHPVMLSLSIPWPGSYLKLTVKSNHNDVTHYYN